MEDVFGRGFDSRRLHNYITISILYFNYQYIIFSINHFKNTLQTYYIKKYLVKILLLT